MPSSSIPRSAAGLSPATGEMSPGAAQTVPHKEPALALANGRLIKEEHRALCTRRTRGQRMTLQHWIRLLTFVNMNRPNTGVGEVMRTFIFRRSQMEVRCGIASSRLWWMRSVFVLHQPCASAVCNLHAAICNHNLHADDGG